MQLLVIVTPNFNLHTTTAFVDPFRAANYLDGRTHFSWRMISVNGGPCLASNGMALETEPLSAATRNDCDMVVVSASWEPEAYYSAELKSALRYWERRDCVIGALDTGAFILAKAGLLKNRRATVHYEHIDAMNELYPGTETSEDLYVLDGRLVTCGGGSASTDLALQLIRSRIGDTIANRAARYIFHQAIRPAGTQQNPDPKEPLGNTIPAKVRQAIKLMEQHLEDPVSIVDLCNRISISQRHLNRLFSVHVNKTPVLYYRDIRLDRARGLVTQTSMPLSEVAIASGFSSQVHFSRAYRSRFGLPPRTDRVDGRVPFEYRAWPMHRKNLSGSAE